MNFLSFCGQGGGIYGFCAPQPQGSPGIMEHAGVRPSACMWVTPQWYMPCKIGNKLPPFSVSEYSTLGGTTGYTTRVISALSSSSRNCCVSILGVASGTSLRNCEKRSVLPVRCHSNSALYFPPISCNVAETGQFVFNLFSCTGVPLSISYSIFLGTILHNSAFLRF